MKIILTGANGFLGKTIYNHFSNEEIIKLGRKEGNIIADLEKEIPDFSSCELIIHAAGKAHLKPKTELERISFTKVNVGGTINLLKGLEKCSVLPKYFVFISSVAVYGVDEGQLIDETYPLNAIDPYGKSKIETEALIKDWCTKNKVIYTILRLPLLAGENPPGNLQSMIKALSKGYYFNIGSGGARKSMVMTSDVANFIEKVFKIGGTFNLTDGHHPSFRELSFSISKQISKRTPLSLPYGLAKLLAIFGDFIGLKAPINSNKLAKMTKSLTFSDTKARKNVGWNPQSVIDNFIVKFNG